MVDASPNSLPVCQIRPLLQPFGDLRHRLVDRLGLLVAADPLIPQPHLSG